MTTAIDILDDEISRQEWESHKVVLRKAKSRIKALGDCRVPVTVDPIATIDDMMEEEAKKDDQHLHETKHLHAWRVLRELKNRLIDNN